MNRLTYKLCPKTGLSYSYNMLKIKYTATDISFARINKSLSCSFRFNVRLVGGAVALKAIFLGVRFIFYWKPLMKSRNFLI